VFSPSGQVAHDFLHTATNRTATAGFPITESDRRRRPHRLVDFEQRNLARFSGQGGAPVSTGANDDQTRAAQALQETANDHGIGVDAGGKLARIHHLPGESEGKQDMESVAKLLINHVKM
jgi:hypothetical protein